MNVLCYLESHKIADISNNQMKNLALNNIDPGDIEDLLQKVEASFDIKFETNELEYVNTYGKLSKAIKGKIELEQTEDCTSQLAFYKLRQAIVETLNIDKSRIIPEALLDELLPRKLRKVRLRELEDKLGFELDILRPPHFVIGFLTLLFLGSFIMICFNWIVGMIGFAIAIGGFWISNKLANELELATVGELSKKMTRTHYVQSRRNKKTYNKKEIDNILLEWFSVDLGIDKSKLTPDAKLS